MVRGGDGKEYGPVTLQQLTAWVREGRLTAQQEVRRSDMEHWTPAANFAELQPLWAGPQPTAPPVVTSASAATGAHIEATDPGLYAQMRSGASWFYWIAGLSLANSILALFGYVSGFLFGLGVTQILDGMARRTVSGGKTIALILDVAVAGVFVLFGVFSNRGHSWAFLLGMILFALDGLVFVANEHWIPVAFHAFALFCLFRGFMACLKLKTNR